MDSSFGTSFAISKLCPLIGIGLHLLPSFHSHRCIALFAHPSSPPRSCWRRSIEIARVRIQAPIFISWRRYRSGIFASSLNYALLLLASCGFKQKPLLFEQPSWVGAKVQSKSSGSVLFCLGVQRIWASVILFVRVSFSLPLSCSYRRASFICVSISLPSSCDYLACKLHLRTHLRLATVGIPLQAITYWSLWF